MEVTYRLSDLYAVNFRSWRIYLRGIILIELILVAIMVGFPVLDGQSLGQAISWADWTILGIVGLLVLLLWAVLPPLIDYFRRWRRGDPAAYKFSLLQTGVKFLGPESEGTIFWSALKRVMSSDRRLYLYIGPGSAFIMPRRAFESDAEFQHWCDYALNKWQTDRKA